MSFTLNTIIKPSPCLKELLDYKSVKPGKASQVQQLLFKIRTNLKELSLDENKAFEDAVYAFSSLKKVPYPADKQLFKSRIIIPTASTSAFPAGNYWFGPVNVMNRPDGPGIIFSPLNSTSGSHLIYTSLTSTIAEEETVFNFGAFWHYEEDWAFAGLLRRAGSSFLEPHKGKWVFNNNSHEKKQVICFGVKNEQVRGINGLWIIPESFRCLRETQPRLIQNMGIDNLYLGELDFADIFFNDRWENDLGQ